MKRKENIINPREKARKIKVRITNKNYKTSKEEEHKDSQEEGEEVIEAEPLLDITHDFNDKNSSIEL